MTRFIYLYRGPATAVPDFTPEQGAERMAAFSAWMRNAGTALVDPGSPFGGARPSAMTALKEQRAT